MGQGLINAKGKMQNVPSFAGIFAFKTYPHPYPYPF
jgi:hypothetical protein